MPLIPAEAKRDVEEMLVIEAPLYMEYCRFESCPSRFSSSQMVSGRGGETVRLAGEKRISPQDLPSAFDAEITSKPHLLAQKPSGKKEKICSRKRLRVVHAHRKCRPARYAPLIVMGKICPYAENVGAQPFRCKSLYVLPAVPTPLVIAINGVIWANTVYPKQEPKQYEHHCPECGGGLEYGIIPCPDGRPGCCVLHYGYRCVNCGTIWHIKPKPVSDSAHH